MICGVDEAGRGPIFGPLVVAAVSFMDEELLISLNVNDSKQLSVKRRETLAKEIRKHAKKIEILIIPATDIDDMRKVMTINEIEVFAFSKVIQKTNPELCYVDSADVNEERFAKDILSKIPIKPKIVSKHKADEIYPIVSAASIIAKTVRDNEIKIISKELEKKLDIPLGSGYPADPITQEFLRTWVYKYKKLPPYVRKSWKTAKRIIDTNKLRRLDDF
ncbi:MAG: ribonuclease HII [Candidatus Lokiarchaeota archaeon]|nr:ribonuclease HII [Candidatus Lokiarchaeota archaeon]